MNAIAFRFAVSQWKFSSVFNVLDVYLALDFRKNFLNKFSLFWKFEFFLLHLLVNM